MIVYKNFLFVKKFPGMTSLGTRPMCLDSLPFRQISTFLGSGQANHNCLSNMGRVLYDDWQRSVTSPDLKSHMSHILFLWLPVGLFNWSILAFWSTPVDNAFWKSRFQTNTHLQISLAMPGYWKYLNQQWIHPANKLSQKLLKVHRWATLLCHWVTCFCHNEHGHYSILVFISSHTQSCCHKYLVVHQIRG